MTIYPYLGFNGNCAEAFEFYARCLNGTITMQMTYGESPMAAQTAPELHGKMMHMTLVAEGATLQGADAPPQHYEATKGVTIAVGLTDADEAERIFNALAEDATVIRMPLQKTFWAEKFGMVVDKFGIPWMVNAGPDAS